ALGLIAILLWTVVSNALVCVSVKAEKRLRNMPHYFLVSMATLHITMATLVMPPAIMVLYKGSFVYGEELCKAWVTLELVFCNCTCLHVAFLSMDTFLRLKDPQHRLQAPPAACSLLLWLAAPWAISAVQGVAHVTSFSGHTNLAFVEHLGSATDQSSSCTLLLRDGGVSTPVAEEDRCCPDEWLRHEYALSRLTICLLACCVAPWLPYALSNIVFAVCESCMASASQYSVLKWLAYCSAASAPLAQLRFSDGFRQTVCRILSC
ncbi:hypothetical protein CAPTEDRAFT_54448, partial [Capitella teleta]